LALFNVISDEILEMAELAVWDKNGGKCLIVLPTDIEQLDARALTCQAIKSKFNSREADEFNLYAIPILDVG